MAVVDALPSRRRLANPAEGVPFGGFTNETGDDPAAPPPPPARWERIDHGHI